MPAIYSEKSHAAFYAKVQTADLPNARQPMDRRDF